LYFWPVCLDYFSGTEAVKTGDKDYLYKKHIKGGKGAMPREPIKLKKEDYERLQKLEPDIEWLAMEIARAKRAGLDVSDLEKKFEETRRMREGLLREYAPE